MRVTLCESTWLLASKSYREPRLDGKQMSLRGGRLFNIGRKMSGEGKGFSFRKMSGQSSEEKGSQAEIVAQK